MKWNSKLKKSFLIGISILVIGFACKQILDFYISKKITQFLEGDQSLPYHITYKSLKLAPFYTKLELMEIQVETKTAPPIPPAWHIKGAIQNIQVSGIHPFQLLKGTDIQLNEIKILKPNLNLINTPITDTILKHTTPSSNLNISLQHLSIQEGAIRHQKHSITTIQNFNLTADSIAISPFKTDLPAFKNLNLQVEKIHHDTQNLYDLYTNQLTISDQHVQLNNLELVPKYSRQEHISKMHYADDIYKVQLKQLELHQLDWRLDSLKKINVVAKQLNLDSLETTIHRNTSLPLNPKRKSMFSAKLRTLPFGMQVEKTILSDAIIVYEETNNDALAPGRLSFNRFNAELQHLNSGHGLLKTPDTEIKVQALFMNQAPLEVDWSFNVLDQHDNFKISGHIRNLDAAALNTFLHPYTKTATKGTLDYVAFNFYGDQYRARGSFALQHRNLEVILYKPNGKEKRKFLTKVGNWFIRQDSEGKTHEVAIKEVEKIQEKSFFNYLWLCLMQGLKQTIL